MFLEKIKISRMNFLLSIIIPTKDRYSTLIPVVETILDMCSLQCEVLIHDNSSDNSPIIGHFEHRKNLSYYYLDTKMSQSENSDQAVLHAKGDYVCFLGDDDCVMPYIENVVKWMKLNDIKILKGNKPQYYWPNQKPNYISDNSSGIISFSEFNYTIETFSCKTALKKALKRGGSSMESLPCLYHGIVKKDVLNRIFNKTGSFFPGPSPDMANGIALTIVEDSFTYVDFPVIISGKSVHSIGGQGVLHKHVARIEDVTHLPKGTLENWSSKVPKYWTGPTIWSESLIKALKSMNEESYLSSVNYSYLYATLYVFNFRQCHSIFKNFNHPIKTLSFFYYLSLIFINRSKVFVNNHVLKNKKKVVAGVVDVRSAVSTISAVVDIKKTPLKFDD
jgi:glycosyltransferase involved in cell wall biosynthesis